MTEGNIPMPEMNVQSQNITFVYDAFSQDDIDPRQIKKLFDGPVIVNDFPEVSLFVWPDMKIIVQIGDRRFRITKQESGNAPFNLWDATRTANAIINKPPIALGLNFDVSVQCEKSSAKVIRQIFSTEIDSITAALSGEIVSFVPRFKLAQERMLYDFIIDTIDNPVLPFIFHVNAHIEKPTADDLTYLDTLFTNQLGHVLDMIDIFIKLGCE